MSYKRCKLGRTEGRCKQDSKSLRVVVMTCAAMVNTQTDSFQTTYIGLVTIKFILIVNFFKIND